MWKRCQWLEDISKWFSPGTVVSSTTYNKQIITQVEYGRKGDDKQNILWHTTIISIQLTNYHATFKISFNLLNILCNFQNMVQLLEIYHATQRGCIFFWNKKIQHKYPYLSHHLTAAACIAVGRLWSWGDLDGCLVVSCADWGWHYVAGGAAVERTEPQLGQDWASEAALGNSHLTCRNSRQKPLSYLLVKLVQQGRRRVFIPNLWCL